MKKLIFVNTALILLLLSILLNACWPYKIDEDLIDQESKNYCLFDKGSYWIYQDSITCKTDSVVIDNSIEYTYLKTEVEYNYHTAYEYFMIPLSYYSQDSQCSYDAYLSSAYVIGSGGILRISNKSIYHNGRTRSIYHNGRIGSSLSELFFEAKLNTYLQNDIEFYNVKIFELDYSNSKEKYYWAEYVGLIRMEIYENDTVIVRNLIKYNVKPYKS